MQLIKWSPSPLRYVHASYLVSQVTLTCMYSRETIPAEVAQTCEPRDGQCGGAQLWWGGGLERKYTLTPDGHVVV